MKKYNTIACFSLPQRDANIYGNDKLLHMIACTYFTTTKSPSPQLLEKIIFFFGLKHFTIVNLIETDDILTVPIQRISKEGILYLK